MNKHPDCRHTSAALPSSVDHRVDILALHRTCSESHADPTAPAPDSLQSALNARLAPNPAPRPVVACFVPGTIRGMSLPCPIQLLTLVNIGPLPITWTGSEEGNIPTQFNSNLAQLSSESLPAVGVLDARQYLPHPIIGHDL